MTNDDWQWRYFVGLKPPAPSKRSDAMRELLAAPDPAEERWRQEMREAARVKREQAAQEDRRWLEEKVDQHGPDTVEHLLRRSDPTFRLPDDLRARATDTTKRRRRT